MKKQFRKFICWFVLTGLIYNFAFTFLVYELSRRFNKDSVENYFSDTVDDQLMILRVTNESSIIRKSNSEIIYDGKIYDVKKEVVKNGIDYFYCYHDVTEENINSILTEILKSNSDTQNNSNSCPSACLIKPVTKSFFQGSNVCCEPDTIILRECSFISDDIFQPNCFSNVISPPPDSEVIN